MIDKLVRENIRRLQPYSSARNEFKGKASVYLDANENAFDVCEHKGLNRYPDPYQNNLKQAIATVKGVQPARVFLGNGSDEIIDLAFRIFCEPGRDHVIICDPTYGMYEVCAQINNIEVKKVLLKADFQLDVEEILDTANECSKLLFICSPNNPTGNIPDVHDVDRLIQNFNGLVIIDEAYIDFTTCASWVHKSRNYENLLVIQTLSKAWGMAGLRIGIAFGADNLLQWFHKVKPPYNINSKSQELAIEALSNTPAFNDHLKRIIEGRQLLYRRLMTFPFVQTVYESEANFLLIRVKDAGMLYKYLANRGIVVRNRSRDAMLENCLRITIGTECENMKLIKALEEFKNEESIIY